MEKHKKETFVYEGFGFPILLVNAPLRLSSGEWVIDINFNKFRSDVLNELIHKQAGLRGAELRFIRKYMEMTTTELGKALGVTHATVLKWESEENSISPMIDIYIRLYVLQRLQEKNETIGKFVYDIVPEHLSRAERSNEPLRIEAFA